ncbi:MAG: hypothetical protein MUE41_18205, partial [Gemmatimonadaceae bacterium]|nr:hypothetical protein [Gemmatimonadaceae bacterium]
MRRLFDRAPVARAAALLAVAGAAFAVPPTPLTVARTSPAEIGARDTMLIVFDRPVAGSLDYAADPPQIVSIAPAVDARIEWRDPITLRVVPRVGFALATRYTVTVANRFRAMDGSTLATPYRYAVRVRGPALETRADTLRQLPRTPRFTLRFTHPVNAARVARLATLRLTSGCGAPAPALRLASSQPREVVLEATAALPLDCLGTVQVPREIDATAAPTAPPTALEQRTAALPFRVHGAFRVTEVACDGFDWCPTGGVRLQFSTPVEGRRLRRALTLAPSIALTLDDTTSVRTRWSIDASLRPRTTYAAIIDTSLRDIFGQRLTGNNAGAVRTTGFQPVVTYTSGRVTVERKAFGTFPITTLNIDTLQVEITPIPREREGELLASSEWGWGPLLDSLAGRRQVQRITPTVTPDRARLVSVPLTGAAGGATL